MEWAVKQKARACTIAVDQVTTYVLNSLGWYFRLEEDSERILKII